MKKIETNLKDCYILEPAVFGDDRGYFSPYFIQEDLNKEGIFFDGVVQTNRSKSSKGVLRGMHFQKDPKCQTKIVEVINGAAIDVVVDIREGSPTYGDYTYVLLKPYDANDKESGKQLYVPRGFAHGFVSLEDDTVFQYLIDNDYAPEMEAGIPWNDPDVNIPWEELFQKYGILEPQLSEKDGKHLVLSKSPKYFTYEGDK